MDIYLRASLSDRRPIRYLARLLDRRAWLFCSGAAKIAARILPNWTLELASYANTKPPTKIAPRNHKLANARSRTSRRKSASCSLTHIGGEKRMVWPQ